MKHVPGFAPEIQRGLAKAVDLIVATGAKRATKFISEHCVISVARPWFRGHRGRRGHSPRFVDTSRRVQLSVKIGTPNYNERKFIKAAVAAGEPFPVRKVQLRFPPQRKAA